MLSDASEKNALFAFPMFDKPLKMTLFFYFLLFFILIDILDLFYFSKCNDNKHVK